MTKPVNCLLTLASLAVFLLAGQVGPPTRAEVEAQEAAGCGDSCDNDPTIYPEEILAPPVDFSVAFGGG